MLQRSSMETYSNALSDTPMSLVILLCGALFGDLPSCQYYYVLLRNTMQNKYSTLFLRVRSPTHKAVGCHFALKNLRGMGFSSNLHRPPCRSIHLLAREVHQFCGSIISMARRSQVPQDARSLNVVPLLLVLGSLSG